MISFAVKVLTGDHPTRRLTLVAQERGEGSGHKLQGPLGAPWEADETMVSARRFCEDTQ